MIKLENKSVKELRKIRDKYVKKYIGDFKKPNDYKLNLKIIDKIINN